MVDFTKDTSFDLKSIDEKSINENIMALLIDGEKVIEAFSTSRDQMVFTNHRVIALDTMGITGKKKFISILPYKMIQYFSVTTVGLQELIPDAELDMVASDGRKFQFEFKGKCNIVEIVKNISNYVLKI